MVYIKFYNVSCSHDVTYMLLSSLLGAVLNSRGNKPSAGRSGLLNTQMWIQNEMLIMSTILSRSNVGIQYVLLWIHGLIHLHCAFIWYAVSISLYGSTILAYQMRFTYPTMLKVNKCQICHYFVNIYLVDLNLL